MKFEHKPQKVKEAQRARNKATLERMGSAGGKATAEKKEREAIHDARTKELLKEEHDEHLLEAQEHIVPVDPEDPKIRKSN